VNLLRSRKHRPHKPFAVMFPSLAQLEAECRLSDAETALLTSPQTPIVLLRSNWISIAHECAPDSPYLGAMLPYTPLHHLLLAELDFPVVATSGNLSGEPICIDENEAITRLGTIADRFLVHNRRIVRHVDDSVAQVVAGQVQILRRARGYAPLPIRVKQDLPPVLAVGGELKNTIAVSQGKQVFVSQHIGDLETFQAFQAFQQTSKDLAALYEITPEVVAHDLHPDYQSTQFAMVSGLKRVGVQHHYAHVLACMAEHQLEAPVLGICWDGTGYGLDDTIWGGEFLRVNAVGFERAAHLKTFRLPGGEQAVREPRRAALGVAHALFGDDWIRHDHFAPVATFSPDERSILQRMLRQGINAPYTSSMGRLFDAVAALLGLTQCVSYEGQGAMLLEYALDGVETNDCYPLIIEHDGVVNWMPLLHCLLDDFESGVALGEISARFHNSLVEMLVAIANRLRCSQVVLSGGCFQNRYLTEHAVERLRQAGFQAYWHQQLPPNDGGIAVGQLVAAAREMEKLGYVSGYTG
ncbi:MAG: carbamoyltransferase HypF, partial [Anaerolineae bacterium]|nr:carbamoyltransferase HypF [Anaerolineae bacterium]